MDAFSQGRTQEKLREEFSFVAVSVRFPPILEGTGLAAGDAGLLVEVR